MTNDEQPKPVLIPIMPKFDRDGNPSCWKCPLFDMGDYGCKWIFFDYETKPTFGSRPSPGSECPIHNPVASDKMEPL